MRKTILLFFLFGELFLWAQSQSEIERYEEIVTLEKNLYNLEKSVEERLTLLENYLAKIQLSLDLFPQGTFALTLQSIYATWATWKQSISVTLKGFVLEVPKKKGRPKPDLYLKGWVNQQVIFQTKHIKNQYSIRVTEEITIPFKTGDTLRFEIWDKDVFKDDLLDSVTFKSVCLQELTLPLESQYKHFSLQLGYQLSIPTLQSYGVSPFQATYLKAIHLFEDHEYREAVALLTPLAEEEYAPAQAKLGECFLYGKGVAEQPLVAKVWFQKAATQNQLDGHYFLGFVALYKGIGDISQGITSLEFAANGGHADAQYELGKAYWEGKNVPQNSETALSLLKKSEKGGNIQAKLFLEEIKK